MKLTFIHDFPVEFHSKNEVYYSTGFPYSIWQRYLEVFEEIEVISRIKNIENEKNKNISSGENVTFKPIKSYKSLHSLILKSKKIYCEMYDYIKDAEAILIRVPSVLGFLAAQICKKLKKKYAVEVVGAVYEAYWYRGSYASKFFALPFEKIQKEVVKNSTVAIYVTNKFLQERYPTKGETHSGVSNVFIESTNKFEDTPDSLLNRNKIKIGLIGSTYTKYKGHETALKALKQINDGNNFYELELVGQGLSNSVKKNIIKYNLENYVKFRGTIYDRKKLDEWFKTLDIYIQPSKTEGQCRSIIEAINNGVPTIASNVGGNMDSVEKKFTFDFDNWKKLASLIKKITTDDEIRLENIETGLKNIKQFEYEKLRQKRVEALRSYKEVLMGERK